MPAIIYRAIQYTYEKANERLYGGVARACLAVVDTAAQTTRVFMEFESFEDAVIIQDRLNADLAPNARVSPVRAPSPPPASTSPPPVPTAPNQSMITSSQTINSLLKVLSENTVAHQKFLEKLRAQQIDVEALMAQVED